MDFKKYINKLSYPTTQMIKCMPTPPNIHPSMKNDEYERVMSEYKSKMDEYFKSKDTYNKELNKWKRENRRIHEEFKKDLFDELEISDNPKAEILFSKAWEYGHSAGFEEVYNYACDLVELIS